MYKKIILACMALVAFAALALPAAASAVVAKDTAGTPGVGALIDATNTGNTVLTVGGSPNVECSKSTMTGSIVENGPNVIRANITAASFSGTSGAEGKECTSANGPVNVTITSLPWCLSTVEKTDNFTVRGGKCTEGTKNLSFTLDVTTIFGTISCAYTRAGSVSGTFSTGTEASHSTVLTVTNGGPFTSTTGGICPAEGTLDMAYDLYTDGKEHTDANRIWVQ
jgi:hypothetical protein